MGKQVLILGAGVGGVVAANQLRRRLPREHRIVLVERSDRFYFQPSFLWLLVGERKGDQVSRPVRSLVASGVELVQAEVTAVDAAKHQVSTSSGVLSFDYLVLALGADLAPQAVPGLTEATLNFYTAQGAAAVFPALEQLHEGTVVEVVCGTPYKCPAAPWEAPLLVDSYLRQRKRRDKVKVAIYTPEPAPMAGIGPVVGAPITQLLRARGIELHFNTPVSAFNATTKRLVLKQGGEAPFDLALVIPPHTPPAAIAASSLAGPSGWAPVDRATLETATPGVFAIGDNNAIMLDTGKPLPKAGVFASAQAKVAAETIAARINAGTAQTFTGVGLCFLEVGGGKAGMAVADFYAKPQPQAMLKMPARRWHWGKELFERTWLGGPLGRRLAQVAVAIGSALSRVPAKL